jgi:hypothetical protein
MTYERKLNPMFLRNQFESAGRFDIPMIYKQDIAIDQLEIIGIQNASIRDPKASQRLVHCFKDDPKIDPCYNNPEKTFERLKNYACLCTPNYSFYSNMPTALQIEAVFKAHWVGAYWQERQKSVLANVCWGMPDSYDFCFDAYECGIDVIISTLGAGKTKDGFLRGYEEMLKRLQPRTVWCYCPPFPEMTNVTGFYPYEAQKRMQPRVNSQQTDIFSLLEGGIEDVSTWGTIRRVA